MKNHSLSHRATLAGLTALLGAGFTAGCHRAHPPAESGPALPPVSVSVAPVTVGTLAATEEVVGTVRPRVEVTLEAKVSGRIEKLPVEVGARVSQGDLIAALDVREIQAQLAQAGAAEKTAERALARYGPLRKQEAGTQAEYDAVEARQRIAAAAVDQARSMLGYARITAPLDGVVTRKLAEVGDLAAPGRPIITLEEVGRYRLEADVPEALVDRLHLDDTLAVRLASRTEPLEGKVIELAPAADPGSHTFRVKIALPTVPGLRSGQFGRAFVPLAGAPSLQVPTSAVQQRGQLEMVFVVTNNIARMRLVKTGRQGDGRVEILSGLAAGEVIVVKGATRLRDGQPVRTGGQ